ncbi:putative N-acetylgalactosaminyltransferase 9 [Lamellibrachia satsuma]|nr:putative N-acetylgalactosaminyltransferase 9 [Lamellibrachia satsuma]
MSPGGGQERNLATEMRMVSEMKTTEHQWLWTATKGIMDACARVDYKKTATQLPEASVIVSFCDHENVSVLLHTVHSIVQRTPPDLLREVILIDDNTRKAEMKELLQNYVNAVFRGTSVRIYRSTEQLGLIRARLTGIRMAKARVVVSMDSHMEVQPRWLEPLLHEIAVNRKTLAASCLDWIEMKDGYWEYRHGGSMWRTYFDWTFTFGFQQMSDANIIRRKTPTEPVSSPVTIGTIFAIEKQFFEDIGALDEGMLLWGGENIDLPIRVSTPLGGE